MITPQRSRISSLEDKKRRIAQRVVNGELYESQAQLRYNAIDEELNKLKEEEQIYLKTYLETTPKIMKRLLDEDTISS